MNRSIAIGGFMGVGKSTVGRRLAERLGLEFVDLDRSIEKTVGQTIPEIFADRGENGFRALESEALKRALDGPAAVVALGGGTLHHGENLNVTVARAHLVCLGLPLSTIRERVGASNAERPLWADAERLYAFRESLYRSAGHFIAIDEMSVDEVAIRIEEVTGWN